MRNILSYFSILFISVLCGSGLSFAQSASTVTLEAKYQKSGLRIDSEIEASIKKFDTIFSSNCNDSHSISRELFRQFVNKYGEYSYEVEWLCNSLDDLYRLKLDIYIANCYKFNFCLINNIRTTRNGNVNFTFGKSKSENITLFHNLLYQSLYLFGFNGTTAGISRQLASYYLDKKDYSTAYFFASQAIDWYKLIDSTYSFAYEKYLTNIILNECKKKTNRKNIESYYALSMRRGDFSLNSQTARKQILTDFENQSFHSLESAIVLNEYGVDCYINGNYSEAIHYLNKANEIFSDIKLSSSDYPLGIKSLQVINLLTLAEIYSQLSDNADAISCYEKIVDNDNYTISDCNTSTFYSLIRLYNLYKEEHKTITALKHLNEAKRIFNNVERLNIDVLPNLGFEYTSSMESSSAFALLIKILSIERLIESGLYDKALADIDVALSNIPSKFKSSTLYYTLIYYKAKCFYLKREYNSALKVLSSVGNLSARELNLSNIDQYLDYQLLSIECNNALEKYASLNTICQNTLNVLEGFFSNNILTMPTNNQFGLWHSIDPFLSKVNTILFHQIDSFPNSLSTIAHISLLSKGILFYSDSYIKHSVAMCSDERVKELYDLICQEKINSNQGNPELLNSLEAEFFSNQYVKNLLANWNKDNSYDLSAYSSHLKNDEIFIDFIQDFRVKNNSQSNLFANYLHALLITKDGVLKDIPLCCEDEITFDLSNNVLSSNYNTLIWKPLQNELSKYSTIYFSPCGVLNTLPLENTTSSEPTLQGKSYIRLSTIRELAKSHDSGNTVEIFGNIKYSTSGTNVYDANRGGDIQNIIRYGLNDLRYSLPELNNISSTINNSGLFQLQHKPFSGSLATEEAFKGLNGTDVNILHISSHAVYIPTNNDGYISESLSLSNCFIALSDFNTGIKTFPNTHGNDGVLTAWELSSLYFPNLNFVSISTCQSGLGDINNEGVFGLQRGFKKAGAESMLISLWKVSDHATHLLMSEFYKQWMLNHKDKHEALRIAQKYVFNYSNDEEGVEYDYTDPYFWSGFVLLDAK